MALILDGRKVADEVCADLKNRVDDLRESGIVPRLTIVTTGNDAASQVYVRNKLRRAKEIGIEVDVVHHDYLSLGQAVSAIGDNPIIFQLPLEGTFNINQLSPHVTAEQDVDGFVSDWNVAALASGRTPANYPCTPMGILWLLDKYEIELSGAVVCVIGRSNIVGRPLVHMLEQRGATVSLCHSKTPREVLYACVDNADIVISATGIRNIITDQEMCRFDCKLSWLGDSEDIENSDAVSEPESGWNKIFIDVGMNRDEDGKLCGDFDPALFESCRGYSPVPGGVGPMTVAMLMENVVRFYESWS